MKSGKEKGKKVKNSGKNSGSQEKKGRVENLTPFEPGRSGNPEGRPKGKRNFDTLVDLAIEALAVQFAEQHNKQKKNKYKQMKAEDVDIEADIFRQFINRARNGDLKAIDSFLDRRHGKAVQPIEHGGITGNPLTEAQIKAAEAEVEAWQELWTK